MVVNIGERFEMLASVVLGRCTRKEKAEQVKFGHSPAAKVLLSLSLPLSLSTRFAPCKQLTTQRNFGGASLRWNSTRQRALARDLLHSTFQHSFAPILRCSSQLPFFLSDDQDAIGGLSIADFVPPRGNQAVESNARLPQNSQE